MTQGNHINAVAEFVAGGALIVKGVKGWNARERYVAFKHNNYVVQIVRPNNGGDIVRVQLYANDGGGLHPQRIIFGVDKGYLLECPSADVVDFLAHVNRMQPPNWVIGWMEPEVKTTDYADIRPTLQAHRPVGLPIPQSIVISA